MVALHMNKDFAPKQFVSLFNPGTANDRITRLFKYQFGPLRKVPRGGQCCIPLNKW
jgi:hypothetical protein